MVGGHFVNQERFLERFYNYRTTTKRNRYIMNNIIISLARPSAKTSTG